MTNHGGRDIRLFDRGCLPVLTFAFLCFGGLAGALAAQSPAPRQALDLQVNSDTGSYSVGTSARKTRILSAEVGAEVNGRWLFAHNYPQRHIAKFAADGYLGPASGWQVVYSGLSGEPDLAYRIRSYTGTSFGDIQVTVRNTTKHTIHVEAIRSVEAAEGPIVDLAGPARLDRVLSDSFSENEPDLRIRNLADAKDQMHRGVGSQLIYNRQSGESFFIGALTSNRFLTVLSLHLSSPKSSPQIASYEVDATGTTEIQVGESLQTSPPADRVQLNLPVAPGASLPSEPLLFGVSRDYRKLLETYGSLIRTIHHARVLAPPLMGWWSWTADYKGVNSGIVLANARWEAQHLKPLGYAMLHIDEGYDYARGEYTTPNAAAFPHGLAPLYYKIRGMGLTPGIWTAPFEVSSRSWVYQHHKDWLLKNCHGAPIAIGDISSELHPAMKAGLFVLDTTNPGTQSYLRKTYSALVSKWNIRYIKLDFMDNTAIEGCYDRPNTTALEAQRIGLQVIRDAVGDGVLLDKDGSPMLNPVGLVDYGRVSVDTSHSFDGARHAEPGIAARYYMNRNFYVSDPDAFEVSEQQGFNESDGSRPPSMTLNEAKVSIALAAVAGGMFEIGDNLPPLWNSPERLALVENRDLIDMIKLGKASIPVDLMNYSPDDEQPSIFFLPEDKRQGILTVFNWTEQPRSHSIQVSTLGLSPNARYAATNVLNRSKIPTFRDGKLLISQPPHSVRVLKIIDTSAPANPPSVVIHHAVGGQTGQTLQFTAQVQAGSPAISYTWDMGDGVKLQGRCVEHAYTNPGEYQVTLLVTGLGGTKTEKKVRVKVSGYIATDFNFPTMRRYQQQH